MFHWIPIPGPNENRANRARACDNQTNPELSGKKCGTKSSKHLRNEAESCKKLASSMQMNPASGSGVSVLGPAKVWLRRCYRGATGVLWYGTVWKKGIRSHHCFLGNLRTILISLPHLPQGNPICDYETVSRQRVLKLWLVRPRHENCLKQLKHA